MGLHNAELIDEIFFAFEEYAKKTTVKQPKMLGNLLHEDIQNTSPIEGATIKYASLYRMDKLSKQQKLHKIGNKQIKKAITNISNGNYGVEVHYIQGKGLGTGSQDFTGMGSNANIFSNRDDLEEHGLLFTLHLSAEDEQVLSKGKESDLHKTFALLITSNIPKFVGDKVAVTFSQVYQTPAIIESISRETMYELNLRVLHHVVRSHGLQIAKLGEGKALDVLSALCSTFLPENWRKKNSVQNAKDAAITGIDIAMACNTLSRYGLAQMIAKLGELYEATGDVELAADLYSDNATFYCKGNSENDRRLADFQIINFYNAGLAFRNTKQLTKAEDQFIQAWHCSYSLNGSVGDHIFTSTLIVYFLREVKQAGSRTTSYHVDTPDKRLNLILGSLLQVAGISNFNESVQKMIDNGDPRTLKSQFRNRRSAIDTLYKLAQVPTTEAFRKAIVNTCALTTITSTVVGTESDPDGSGQLNDHTKSMNDMMDSRNTYWDKDTGKKKAVPYHCSQCRVLESSTGGKLRMCACKTVYYW